MEHAVLGRSGIEVSRLCLGTLTVSPLQANLPPDEGAEVLAYALEHGVTFLDTAQYYDNYEYIRLALKRTGRYDTVISSKSYCYTREMAYEAVEEARCALDRDVIDIFMLHEQESISTVRGHREALDMLYTLKSRGVIRAVGLSCHHVAAVDAAAALGLDEDKRPLWEDIRARLAPFPTGTIDGIRENPSLWKEGDYELSALIPEALRRVPVYYNEGKGGKWSLNFPGNILHIYPGGAVGLDSPKEALTLARNTVAALSEMEHSLRRLAPKDSEVPAAGAWNANNLGCLFFPAAVRVGFDPEVILKELRDKLETTALPNGFVKGNPHGIENLSTVPNTLQEMMLNSHQGTLRIFPVWPRRSLPDARFFNLRARGGFVVSAQLEGSRVQRVEIRCPVGGRLRLENPWPGEQMRVNGVPVDAAFLEKDTQPGEALEILPQ